MANFTYQMDDNPFSNTEILTINLIKQALDYIENEKKATFITVTNMNTNLFVQTMYMDGNWLLEVNTGTEEQKKRKLFRTETKVVPVIYQQFDATRSKVEQYFEDFLNNKELAITDFDKVNM